jgi:hypothetical protein
MVPGLTILIVNVIGSINRKEIRKHLATFPGPPPSWKRPSSQFIIPRGSTWSFQSWYKAMLMFQRGLLDEPNTLKYCKEKSRILFGNNPIIPWGRFLDIYFYKEDYGDAFKDTLLNIWFDESEESYIKAYNECAKVGNDMLFWLFENKPTMYFKFYASASQEVKRVKSHLG